MRSVLHPITVATKMLGFTGQDRIIIYDAIAYKNGFSIKDATYLDFTFDNCVDECTDGDTRTVKLLALLNRYGSVKWVEILQDTIHHKYYTLYIAVKLQ